MTSLLNRQRPPVFCPGCSHERVVRSLDDALQQLGIAGDELVIVTDIGCAGLFDTFFNSHAFHGLHGRALTYATGLKMARPELTVITIMGDGGLGIGGAHVLSSCRRNLDINLLILNNFNYGMTGGQCSATTPVEAITTSGFLNQLEPPLDICRIGVAAGAPWVCRSIAADRGLTARIKEAIAYRGFSLMDIWGVCPGRYSKRNKVSHRQLGQRMALLPDAKGRVADNERPEFGSHYRERAEQIEHPDPVIGIKSTFPSPVTDRCDILLLGAAGQRINTAGEILCLSAMSGGMYVTQKNDYPITVLRGHSVSELVFSSSPGGYTGIKKPHIVLALSAEGVARRENVFSMLDTDCLVIKAENLDIPENHSEVIEIDFKSLGIGSADWALASLKILAAKGFPITEEMLDTGLTSRFSGKQLNDTKSLLSLWQSIDIMKV